MAKLNPLEEQIVKAKTAELISDISSKTGVSADAVTKILDQVGISRAIAGRIKVSQVRVVGSSPPM
jgi:hypothetical protein